LQGVEFSDGFGVDGVQCGVGDAKGEPDALVYLVGGLEGCDYEGGDGVVGGGAVEGDGFAHRGGGLRVRVVEVDVEVRGRGMEN